MKNNPTTINILGNKLTLNCPEGEEELLISSVETLEQKIDTWELNLEAFHLALKN